MSLAIITGASSGIGREFALQLKEKAGIDSFCLIARRKERLLELERELGVPCTVICADLTESEGIEKIRAYLNETRPRVKFLVNSAGFGDFGAFDEISEETVLKMIDLNVRALVQLTHMCIPFMEKGGRIIEMGSGSCFTPLPYFNVYSSSKVFVLHIRASCALYRIGNQPRQVHALRSVSRSRTRSARMDTRLLHNVRRAFKNDSVQG